MKKLLRKISVCFLWIAAIMVTAHLIIPHDHHSADSFSNQDKDCPVSDHGPNHHSGLPLHCHAFNDLTSEKLRSPLVSEINHFNFLKISIQTDSSLVLPFSSFHFKEVPGSFHDSSFSRSSFFRGPPSLA
ncbi:MAG: hypothetical protein IPJ16_12765 [Bacteroidales bacterium]|nr:hypothetical protein [Bacteroidales bacterium]